MIQRTSRFLELLMDLRENHAAIGVKAEFEDEGARLEEVWWLKELATSAHLELTIKIGGCGALTDLYIARQVGASNIVAPMIESPFALEKFLSITKRAFGQEEYRTVAFWINIETINAVGIFDQMLIFPGSQSLKGIVVGRVDLVCSLNRDRDHINSPEVLEITKDVLIKAKAASLECAVGGGVSAQALDFFRALPNGHLSRYETRKVVFSCPDALGSKAEEGLLKAAEFELLWLKSKRDYYGQIATEDEARIAMLEARQEGNIAALKT